MKSKKVTIDDLAGMIKVGFDGVDARLDTMGREIVSLKTGQEAIFLRLDNVAYRFEMTDLEKRVDRLEQKTGISRP